MTQTPPCPYCGASNYRLREKRWLICQGCGQEFDVRRDVCAACGTVNRIDAVTCRHCEARLRKDTIDQIIEARSKDRNQWNQERVAVAVQQKQTEEEASRQRMETFWAEEQARREAVARATAERRQREHKLLLIVGIAGALLVLCLIAAALVLSYLLKQPI